MLVKNTLLTLLAVAPAFAAPLQGATKPATVAKLSAAEQSKADEKVVAGDRSRIKTNDEGLAKLRQQLKKLEDQQRTARSTFFKDSIKLSKSKRLAAKEAKDKADKAKAAAKAKAKAKAKADAKAKAKTPTKPVTPKSAKPVTPKTAKTPVTPKTPTTPASAKSVQTPKTPTTPSTPGTPSTRRRKHRNRKHRKHRHHRHHRLNSHSAALNPTTAATTTTGINRKNKPSALDLSKTGSNYGIFSPSSYYGSPYSASGSPYSTSGSPYSSAFGTPFTGGSVISSPYSPKHKVKYYSIGQDGKEHLSSEVTEDYGLPPSSSTLQRRAVPATPVSATSPTAPGSATTPISPLLSARLRRYGKNRTRKHKHNASDKLALTKMLVEAEKLVTGMENQLDITPHTKFTNIEQAKLKYKLMVLRNKRLRQKLLSPKPPTTPTKPSS